MDVDLNNTSIYRMTHIDNLASVMRDGAIYCSNHYPPNGDFVTIHNTDVQSKRACVFIPFQLALQQINVDFKWTEKQDRFTATIELDDPKRITIGDVIAKGDDPTTIIETKIKKTVKKEVEQQIKARKAKRGKKADSTKPHGKK